ncbi:3-isopropylmalate dehydrogenase [Dehalobacterium formicoaceticum]|uniref:3-isopropylmalate dehydrogenase n=1 Tax=Dehalobacterium formicoaceticum TaxID=51515 RepID=A0ABT1Y1H4_9FIRM|nr:3-isopropylmalate dehydrogenase [Dehalobacterium formicoaceticum]MCR6544366.1 3-isopropylmalate dehydrogenase [Dehalobacterium formicoaceticum]
MRKYQIAVLPGDGIGTEIVPPAVEILKKVGAQLDLGFTFQEALIGGAAIDETGVPLPKETLDLCKKSDAVLLGAIGGPKWDHIPTHLRPEVGALLPLRKELALFANIRPVILYDELVSASTLKEEVVTGTDMVVIRELTGGLYFGEKKREKTATGERAVDTLVYTTEEIERIARLAFENAQHRRKKLTSVDKANVLESGRLWRETVTRLAQEYPDVEVEHMYVDNCAMQLVRAPKQFDVIVTENTFGDILTDQASMISGSIGMLPSASIGGKVGLYEPSHGSAPDIAGMDRANPLATILSAAMMLEYSFKELQGAGKIKNAVAKVLKQGYRTGDLAQEGTKIVGTKEMGALVLAEI